MSEATSKYETNATYFNLAVYQAQNKIGSAVNPMPIVDWRYGISDITRRILDMTNRSTSLLITFGYLMSLAAMAQTSNQRKPELSGIQLSVVNGKIAALKSPVDRHVAESWSNAKKVSELLCRPAALPVLRKQAPSVDRVFLGTDDPHTLNLESNRRLTGSGEFRTPKGWQDFTFTCELDPETGKVTSFQPVLASAKP